MIEFQNTDIEVGGYALRNLSFHLEAGTYAVLMGRTGIGKTTILEAICGLRRVVSGRVIVGGIDVTYFSPADRRVGYVPQDLALFPSMNVQEHLEFAMKLRRRPSSEIRDRVEELSTMLGVRHLLTRKTHGLSGGESQRVALGRALSFGPSVLLLDEPLSALDVAMRTEMQGVLSRMREVSDVTVLHVTHNPEEAQSLANVRLTLVKDDDSGAVEIRREA